MRLFDTHCHLQDSRFGEEIGRLLEDSRACGVERVLCCATEPSDWSRVAMLARTYPMVQPAFGVHPWYCADRDGGWVERLLEYLDAFPDACVGETGLDGLRGGRMAAQEAALRRHLEVAAERGRVVSLHCVRAWGALLDILRTVPDRPRFVVHAFAGSLETASELVAMGGLVSLSGLVCHERACRVRRMVAGLPPEAFVVETDAPDMNPDAGSDEPCRPALLPAVVKAVAALRREPEREVAARTWRRAVGLFGGGGA